MEQQLIIYFKSEKQAALVCLLIGLAAMALGIASIFFWQGDVWRGLRIPLMAISAIQIVVGGNVYFRTNKQLKHLLTLLKEDPKKLVQIEMFRMAKVNRAFGILRNVELLLVLLGLFFSFMGAMGSWGEFVFGTGLGLALQSGMMLVFDLFAEWRAGFYTHKVEQLGRQLGVH